MVKTRKVFCDNCKELKDGYASTKSRLCIDCQIKNAMYYQEILKEKVVKHYSQGSMNCKCCGESNIHFLTIDHVVPLNGPRVDIGSGFYRRLVKEGFPDGYQVFCYNCNLGKRKNKECPHKASQEELTISFC